MPFTLSRTSMSRPATAPQSLPVFFSPSLVLHETTMPLVTTIFGGSATAAAVVVVAEADVALAIPAAPVAFVFAVPPAGGASGARPAVAPLALAAADAASPGALGPTRTPTSFGHATPTMNP